MDSLSSIPRRRLLGGVVSLVAIGSLAGCSGDDSSQSDDGSGSADDTESADENGADTDDSDGSGDGDDGSDSGDGDDGSDGEQLDLREANVVGASVEGDGGSYGFDVALHHDDDGEEGYANWWQVERLDGTRLGRRELLHAHSRQPFTRSETIDVPDGVGCVVVRGHDQTHGYGGQVMLVNLDTGGTRSVDQGTERRSFGVSDCP
jgi:hypothetical protein